MALSNIYKPETNTFSLLASDDDDDNDDSEELDDEIDDSYGKGLHRPTRNVQKPLMARNRTRIRRVHSKPWCTTRACFVCSIWFAFFSICAAGLVLLIIRAIDSVDSQSHFVKKVLLDKQDSLDDESNFVPCDELYTTKVWHATFSKLMTETAVRPNDVNEDGVDDLMIGFATGVDVFNAPKFSCDLYFNGTYPCYGGLLALDGKTGQEIWRHYTMHEIYGVNCNGDLDTDGVRDCLISGKAGVFEAISGKTGNMIWEFGPQECRDTNMNLYTGQFIRDLNNDGVMEVLVTHGGDPIA